VDPCIWDGDIESSGGALVFEKWLTGEEPYVVTTGCLALAIFHGEGLEHNASESEVLPKRRLIS